MYIITREDLPPGYQGVQSCHAVAKIMTEQGRPRGWDDTMVWLSCKSEEELETLLKSCKHLTPVPFMEPDLMHQMTSFAVFVPENQRYLFSGLRLALGQRQVSLAESIFMLKISIRNLVSEVLKAWHLHELQRRFDKNTQEVTKELFLWLEKYS